MGIFSNIGRRFFFLFLLFTSLMMNHQGQCQGEFDLGKFSGTDKIDTNYIANYSELVTTRLFGLFQASSFNTYASGLNHLSYRPNVAGRLGIAAYYKWFGLGVSLGIPYLIQDKGKYGKTSFYDLRANAYGNQFTAEVFIQNYQGFYIGNKEGSQNTVYLIPDMRIFSTGITVYYFYNYKRFSIRAAFIQTERQKKSAGSLAIRPSIIYFRLNSDNGIVPPSLAASVSGHIPENTKEGYFYSFGLSPGYSYTLVFLKNFYVNAQIFPGFFFQTGSYNTTLEVRKAKGVSLSLNLKAAIGYNSGRWFIGGSLSTGFGGIPATVSGADYYYDVTQFRVWGGTRFNWFRKKK